MHFDPNNLANCSVFKKLGMQWAKDERGGLGVDLAADAAMGLSGAAQRHRPTATALAGEAAGGQGALAELNAADADAFARRNEISEESKSGGARRDVGTFR